jgi:gluconolactonase
MSGFYMYDSLAVDATGNVCVATLITGGISIVSPNGAPTRFVPLEDRLITNICFGGEGLRTAYITASSVGELHCVEWEVAGLPLNFSVR